MIPVTPRLSSQRSRSSRINCAAPSTAFDLYQSRCPELSRRAQRQPPRSQRLDMCKTLKVHIATSQHVKTLLTPYSLRTIQSLSTSNCIFAFTQTCSPTTTCVRLPFTATAGLPSHRSLDIAPSTTTLFLSEVSCRHSVLKPNAMGFPWAGCLTVHR